MFMIIFLDVKRTVKNVIYRGTNLSPLTQFSVILFFDSVVDFMINRFQLMRMFSLSSRYATLTKYI